MAMNTHIPREDLALYALGALEAQESAAVRDHLDACESCREELKTVAGDWSLVGMTAEDRPLPEGARQRFLSRIGAKKVVAISANDGRKARAVSLWIPWAIAAGFALLAVGLGMEANSISNALKNAQEEARADAEHAKGAEAVLNLLSASQAQHILLTEAAGRPAPSARAVYLPAHGSLVLEASNLKPIDAGKTYELWIIPKNGGEPIPAGLFRPDATGSASVILPTIPSGVEAKAFGVTIEDAKGASTPTLPIVLAGAVGL